MEIKKRVSKVKRKPLLLSIEWLGDEGSNLDKRSQSPLSYH